MGVVIKKADANVLAAVASAPKGFAGEKLLLQADELKGRSDALLAERLKVLLKLAETTCPYKVGDYLKLNRGLGAGGLVVEEILACQFPAHNNRWAIQTAAIAKDGSISRRTLLLSEWQLLDAKSNAGLAVVEHRGS